MKQTISVAVWHFIVAGSVGYMLTGEGLMAGLIALLEPAVYWLLCYGHRLVSPALARHRPWQAASRGVAVRYCCVAFALAVVLSAELLTEGASAMLQPIFNTVRFWVTQQMWDQDDAGAAIGW
ncbi:DUF2061 domain-containing protein [Aeromonas cavernicola]|nr:DUF2061 domain-containing protein [Aeromonas cavernicola]